MLFLLQLWNLKCSQSYPFVLKMEREGENHLSTYDYGRHMWLSNRLTNTNVLALGFGHMLAVQYFHCQ